MDDFRVWGVASIAWKEIEEEKCPEVENEAIEFFGPPLNLQNNNAFPCAATGLSPAEEVQRYLRLKLEEKWIGLELDSLKPNIVSHCLESGGKITLALGTVQAQLYPLWQYSPAVEEQQRRLNDLRREEQESGKATKIEKTAPCVHLNRDVLAAQIAIHLAPLIDEESEGAEVPRFEDRHEEPVGISAQGELS
jgi:hypothetical protein